jgi:hypothetical protein
MPFSTGQLIFATIFVFSFLIYLFWAYIKDIAMHKKYYKGSLWVVFGFVAFIVLIKLFLALFPK